jgi:hypothetical protein
MTLEVTAAALPPDLRYAVAPALAQPGSDQVLGDMTIRAQGCLLAGQPVPAYLRYSDRSALLTADGVRLAEDLDERLAAHLRAVGGRGDLDDPTAAVVVMDAVDSCFREAGLWAGNIYLAGIDALTTVLVLADIEPPRLWDPGKVSRELAALELAYLFPVARKFRSGDYDGAVQYRLNGWGRAVAKLLAESPAGASRATRCRRALSRHLGGERDRYAAFLGQLDVARQDYAGSRLDEARSLPIPVLV